MNLEDSLKKQQEETYLANNNADQENIELFRSGTDFIDKIFDNSYNKSPHVRKAILDYFSYKFYKNSINHN